jgi:hypothetical protein
MDGHLCGLWTINEDAIIIIVMAHPCWFVVDRD